MTCNLRKLSETLGLYRLHVRHVLHRNGVTYNLCKLSVAPSLHQLHVRPFPRRNGVTCNLRKLSATLSLHRLHVRPILRRGGVSCNLCTLSVGLSLHRLHVTPFLRRRGLANSDTATGPRYSLATSGTENGPGSIPEFNLATAGTPTVGFGHEAYENTQLQRNIWKAILLQLLSRQKVSRELGQCSTLGSRLPPSGKAT